MLHSIAGHVLEGEQLETPHFSSQETGTSLQTEIFPFQSNTLGVIFAPRINNLRSERQETKYQK